CDAAEFSLDRREFFRTVGATAAAAATAGLPLFATPKAAAAPSRTSAAETAVKGLYDALTDDQRKAYCFDWDYVETKAQRPRGLLRTHVSNNWEITNHFIKSDF